MYRRVLTIRIPVLLMALVVALAMVPGEVGEAIRSLGHAGVDGMHQIANGYGKLFN